VGSLRGGSKKQMKKIYHFLCWQWQQFETWQRFWLLAMFLFGCTFTAPDHWRPYFVWPACVIVIGYILKWILYDGIRNAWNKYNEEQEKIVQIIKDSR
jgi:hypothetical protein